MQFRTGWILFQFGIGSIGSIGNGYCYHGPLRDILLVDFQTDRQTDILAEFINLTVGQSVSQSVSLTCLTQDGKRLQLS